MRGRLRTGIAATAAITAAVVLYVAATLPRPAIGLDGDTPALHISGAYHVHSNRSDGTGSVDDIADAAAGAGLHFVILTDHGDGTRPPAPPAYRHGVLIIDAVEINTREGHLVALGLDAASPYPLAGRAADVIADVHRQGGTAVIAHPDSPRSELGWRGGAGTAADGIEWINADSEWRDESVLTLAGRALQSWLRGPQSIAALFSRPAASLQRWDAASRLRPTFGLAALDAHANIPWRNQEEPRRTAGLEYPSYDMMFRTLVQIVVLPEALAGDAARDARMLLDALTAGQSYASVRALAWPPALAFTATRGDTTYPMGARLDASDEATTLRVRLATAPGARVTLLRNGEVHVAGQGGLAINDAPPGVYRVEASLPDTAVPWLVSNPITIASNADGPGGRGGGRGGRGSAPSPGIIESRPIPIDSPRWNIEHDGTSEGTTAVDDGRRRFDYALGAGPARGQYAALAYTPDGDDGVETLTFTAAASAPLRVSIQVRLPDGRSRTGQRWRTSIYLDPTPTPFVLRLQDFEPADRPTARRPIVTPIHSFLIVADTVNALPGSTGSIWLSNVEVGVNRLQ